MAKQWVVNVANGPRMIGGVLLSPGEGTFVDDGPDGAAAPASESTVVALASTRLASMAAAGNAVPSGVLLKDPATGKIFGQSDGLGGYEALGGVGAGSGIFRGVYTWSTQPLTGLNVGDTIRASDVGMAPGTMCLWTGSRMRRMYPFTLFEAAGSVATPVATLGPGITAGTFTLPSVPTIPAAFLEAGNAVMIDALVTHSFAAPFAFNVHLGTAGSTSDSLAVTRTVTAVANRTFHARTEVSFSSTTNFVAAAGVPTNDQTTDTLVDRTTNVDLASAMLATVAVASGNSSDVYKLIWFRLSVP